MNKETKHDPEHDDAVVALITQYQMDLRLYIRSLMPGNSESADVLQQANTTIWKKRQTFELGTNFKAWSFSIARFEVLNYRKRAARDSRLVFSDELEETFAEELPQLSDDLDARHEALKICLQKLRSADQELIHSRYFTEKKLSDYAEEVGRSVGGLKVTLHRLRSRLQKCIEANIPKEEPGS